LKEPLAEMNGVRILVWHSIDHQAAIFSGMSVRLIDKGAVNALSAVGSPGERVSAENTGFNMCPYFERDTCQTITAYCFPFGGVPGQISQNRPGGVLKIQVFQIRCVGGIIDFSVMRFL
jgi:hypothetical protein